MKTQLEEIKLSRALARAVYDALVANVELPSEVKVAYNELQRLYDRQIQEEGL
jgi:hypothetical protein